MSEGSAQLSDVDRARGDVALDRLVADIKAWGRELGFAAVGITDLELSASSEKLAAWLASGQHGDMDYMLRHAPQRADPTRLLPNACRAIVARMDYRPRDDAADWVARETRRLDDGNAAVVSIYARGRDYHKVLRARLQQLATRIADAIGPHGYRVCTDSAPVFEVELARKSGLGWRGKHTLLLSQDAGSMFFLGEILTDLPLPLSVPLSAPAGAALDEHCGTCTRCLDVCPTRAITAPYNVDARRCISYLTIELHGPIPQEFRAAIGNRIYGCDDCQLVCPWNRYAKLTSEQDFLPRHGLEQASLVEFFAWTAQQFAERTAGSAIRRLGHERWLRNVAVALGNAPTTPQVLASLNARRDDASPLVREHVAWALERHERSTQQTETSVT